jgi:integrase
MLAKIKNPGSHRFRHTFATYWLNVITELPGGEIGQRPDQHSGRLA